MTDMLYSRLLAPRIAEALGDTPVVLINGPRQSGKTTLVHSFIDRPTAGAFDPARVADIDVLALPVVPELSDAVRANVRDAFARGRAAGLQPDVFSQHRRLHDRERTLPHPVR